MTKSTQPKARLERWVFYKTGLTLRHQDQATKAKLKADYTEARRVAEPQPTKDPS